MRTVVVFPAPFCPSNARIFPGSTQSDTPSTAQKSLLNCLLKSFVSIIDHLFTTLSRTRGSISIDIFPVNKTTVPPDNIRLAPRWHRGGAARIMSPRQTQQQPP